MYIYIDMVSNNIYITIMSNIGDTPMDANFKQKSAWLTCIALAVVFGNYFIKVWFFPSEAGKSLSNLILVLVIFVIIEIILHIGLAIGQKQESQDERDTDVAGPSYRNSHIAMVTILVSSASYLIMFNIGAVMAAINIMLFTVVVGEFVHQASLIYYYKKGV